MSLVKSFLNEISEDGLFVAHQIESYNDFIKRRMQTIIDELGFIEIELPTQENLKIKLGKVHIGQPIIKESDGATREIMPMEARLRKLTYSSPLFVEMTPVFEDIEHETSLVNIGNFPVMVKSCLCPLSKMSKEELVELGEDPTDCGGYFIINGIERVLILSEDIASNRLILQKKKGEIVGRLDSKQKGYVQRHQFERLGDGTIVVRFANLAKSPVPVVALMKALGLNTDKEIIDTIVKREGDSTEESAYLNLYITPLVNRNEAVNYIGKAMKVMQKDQIEERVMRVLDNYLLPHLGQDSKSRLIKARYLGKVVKKMILLQNNEIKEDDIDHYKNKRMRLADDLLESILRSILIGHWGLIARLQYNYQKMIKRGRKLPNLQSIVITGVLTKQIMRAMAVGNFANQTGVSQKLEKSNFTRAIEHLRGVVSPLSSTQEHFEARELHSTHWGRLCAIRTPEGQNIGLRKFLALGAQVTTKTMDEEVEKVEQALKSLGVKFE